MNYPVEVTIYLAQMNELIDTKFDKDIITEILVDEEPVNIDDIIIEQFREILKYHVEIQSLDNFNQYNMPNLLLDDFENCITQTVQDTIISYLSKHNIIQAAVNKDGILGYIYNSSPDIQSGSN